MSGFTAGAVTGIGDLTSDVRYNSRQHVDERSTHHAAAFGRDPCRWQGQAHGFGFTQGVARGRRQAVAGPCVGHGELLGGGYPDRGVRPWGRGRQDRLCGRGGSALGRASRATGYGTRGGASLAAAGRDRRGAGAVRRCPLDPSRDLAATGGSGPARPVGAAHGRIDRSGWLWPHRSRRFGAGATYRRGKRRHAGGARFTRGQYRDSGGARGEAAWMGGRAG